MSNEPVQHRVCYHDRTMPVLLGDRVQLRVFLRRRMGQVTYVPGISAVNEELEYGGLTWVGIQIDNGPAVGKLVDPTTSSLEKAVRFVGRDTPTHPPIQPGERVFEED